MYLIIEQGKLSYGMYQYFELPWMILLSEIILYLIEVKDQNLSKKKQVE